MDSESDANVPSMNTDAGQAAVTRQAEQDATELTLICLASDQSVQTSAVAGAENIKVQTGTIGVKDGAASVTTEIRNSEADGGVDCESPSTPSPDDVLEKDNLDLVDDKKTESNPQCSDSPSTPLPCDVLEKDTLDAVDDQQSDLERSQRSSELQEGNAPATVTYDLQRSISQEETPCTEHFKEKTSAYCDTCDVKVCLRCIIGEHRPHEIVPYEDKFEKDDQDLKTRVASIQEACGDAEKLEAEIESSREKYVKNTQELIAGIEAEEAKSKDKLIEQRDEEMKKIQDAYDTRTAQLAERRREKVEDFQLQEKEQLEDIERRLSESRELRKQATRQTHEMTSTQEGMQLDRLNEAIVEAATVSSELEDNKEALTDSEVHTPHEDNEDIEKHGELRARVEFGSYQCKTQQTVVSGSLRIKDLTDRVATLTKKTAKERWNTTKIGDVAVKPTSITQNRQYTQGGRQLPVPVEAPDSSKSLFLSPDDDVATDVMFLPAGEAEELVALVGGGSDMMKYDSSSITLKSQKGPELFRESFPSFALFCKTSEKVLLGASLVNKAANKKAIEENKYQELRGYHYYFPADTNLRDCVLKAKSNFVIAKLTCYEDGEEIDPALTVREWRKKHEDFVILF